jgi:serine/threonine protein kinase
MKVKNNILVEEIVTKLDMHGIEILSCKGITPVSMVFQGFSNKNNQFYAIKIQTQTECYKNVFENEIQTLSQLQSLLITPKLYFYGNLKCGNKYMIMEWVELPSFHSTLNSSLTIAEKLILISQATNSIYSLHRNGIIHNDISMEHLFIDQYSCIKLIDFGCALNITTHPEAVNNDLFSLTVVFAELLLNINITNHVTETSSAKIIKRHISDTKRIFKLL